ncbi:MAG TPA: DUF4919 domain-containing protein [Trebonia sp.]|nr:DUF4919 domain-containing protein [Trebonia sp.]
MPGPALAQGKGRGVPSGSAYTSLLERVARGDTLIDFQSLRMAYARSATYDPSSHHLATLRRQLREGLGNGDLSGVAALADSMLALNPVDIESHVVAAYTARERGDSVTAQRHAAIARGLGRSFDGAHRGASLEAPVLLVAASEEESFGRMNGLEYMDSTRLVDCPSGYCDVVVFRDPKTGTDTTLFFDLTLQVRWMLQHNKK